MSDLKRNKDEDIEPWLIRGGDGADYPLPPPPLGLPLHPPPRFHPYGLPLHSSPPLQALPPPPISPLSPHLHPHPHPYFHPHAHPHAHPHPHPHDFGHGHPHPHAHPHPHHHGHGHGHGHHPFHHHGHDHHHDHHDHHHGHHGHHEHHHNHHNHHNNNDQHERRRSGDENIDKISPSIKEITEIQQQQEQQQKQQHFKEQEQELHKLSLEKIRARELVNELLKDLPTEKPIGNIATQNLDLCFLLDCTASMQPYIDRVKNDIALLYNNIVAKFTNLDLQFAAVCYSDFDRGDKRTSSLPFTKSTNEFMMFLSNVVAAGGDDGPEDVFGGFKVVFENTWRKQSIKVLIHICDAPCHGNQYHRFQDNYPNGDPFGITHEQVVDNICRFDLNYFFGYVNIDSTSSMIHILSQTLKILSNNQLQINSFDAKDIQSLSDNVYRAVSESIQRRQQQQHKQQDQQQQQLQQKQLQLQIPKEIDNNIDKELPDWSTIREVRVYQRKFQLPRVLFECLEPNFEMNIQEIKCNLKIAPKPFAKGTNNSISGQTSLLINSFFRRYSYYGHNVTNNKRAVLKLFINEADTSRGRRRQYYDYMETQTIAAKFAFEFNREFRKDVITFGVSKVIEGMDKDIYYGLETFYDGDYEKYNSVVGWKNHSLEPVIQAFSHWTYVISDKSTIVVDLEGVVTDRGLILMDPVIHSIHLKRYGTTNQGQQGIDNFFKTHTCNQHCYDMRLTKSKP
ncbi:protein serine/threonine kinase [Heterostelium album PN500]|uniref:Protein serine/threonine kinase n=1 Tax=Heterostelium pallidum (strain ATCC 26659 / Pp 5 / PN500) TaxID=670386 RepID=D3BUA3_HETP5|nr:protein serine/threonine kinase [Heterostelium album PN500]EFA75037.1 protein serine/threonine kinase [Heterostelium album PN500]|eukprot:XP_020427171.1 protein serine/threonine kinase [Heterostelium album PN500]